MTDTIAAEMRMKRIERLIRELEYEIVRGVMDHEIEPDIHFAKVFPCAGRGDNLARIDLHVSPAHKYDMSVPFAVMPKLRVVT